MTQVFSCCHLGGSMDFDGAGNLYFATGDNTGNAPNSTNGGYTNAHPNYTLPCPGDTDLSTYEGTGCGVDTSDPDGARAIAGPNTMRGDADHTAADPGLAGRLRLHLLRRRAPDLGQLEHVRGQAAAHHAGRQPARQQPGRRHLVHDPGRDRPERPEPVHGHRPSRAARRSPRSSRWASATSTRSTSTSVTGKISAAWVGPDQGTNSVTWGPAKTENAVLISSAGNYGWPYCTGNQQGYRAKLPATTGGGVAGSGRPPRHRSGQRPGRGPGRRRLLGLRRPGRASRTTRRTTTASTGSRRRGRRTSGTARRAVATTSRATPTTSRSTPAPTTRPSPASYRRCPFVFGGGQAPMTGGIYRKPAGDAPNAWPSYWDGRWFLADYAGGINLRHALLMDPATEFIGRRPGRGRLAVRDHPDGADEQQPHHRPRLRARWRALRRRLRRIELRDRQQRELGPALRLHRWPGHPGSRPAGRRANTNPAQHDVLVQHRQVRWRLVQVGLLRRRHGHRRERHLHVQVGGQRHQADGDADRHLRGRHDRVEDDRRPGADDGPGAGHPRRAEDARPDVRLRRGRVRRLRPGCREHVRGVDRRPP